MINYLFKLSLMQKFFVTILIGFSGLLGCSMGDSSLDAIKASGKLVVLTRNAPTTYFFDSNEQATGPEYDMVESFAASLGVRTEYKLFATTEEILEALQQGQGNLAAAGLTRTQDREKRFRFGPVYQEVAEQMVCRKNGKIPKNQADLAGLNIAVSAGTSYEESLRLLQASHPDLLWQAEPALNTEQLLEKVWLKEIDCTVADANIVAINRRYFPELIVTFDLTKPRPLAWAVDADNGSLQKAMEVWFKNFQSQGKMDQVIERYYEFIAKFDYVDTKAFQRAVHKKYPRFRSAFEEAAKRHDLDPLLLSAQGYQESHWNPRAKSPTGVRGMMMLTLPTAKALGVKNRLDPYESITGGAEYFSKLLRRFDDAVKHPDRSWLALAAYNVGRGHLHDAQKLARRLGKNPYVWSDLKEVLPLLSQKKYYSTLKYGYARGREPVRYVQRIRNYRDLLEKELEN